MAKEMKIDMWLFLEIAGFGTRICINETADVVNECYLCMIKII